MQRRAAWRARLASFGALHFFSDLPLSTSIYGILSTVRHHMENGPLHYTFAGLDVVLEASGSEAWNQLPFLVLMPRNKGKVRATSGNIHLERASAWADLTLAGLKNHPSMLGTKRMPSPAYDVQANTVTMWIGTFFEVFLVFLAFDYSDLTLCLVSLIVNLNSFQNSLYC